MIGTLTELGNVGNVESLHERGPNLRSQAVSEHDTDVVLPLFGHFLRGQEIATNFTDILSGLVVKHLQSGTISRVKMTSF